MSTEAERLVQQIKAERTLRSDVAALGGNQDDIDALLSGGQVSDTFSQIPVTDENRQIVERLANNVSAFSISPAQQMVDEIRAGMPQPEPEDQDFSVLETIKNVPGSAVKYGKDIWNTVRHPIEAGKAIINLADSFGNKMGRKVAEVVTGNEIEPMSEYSEDVANAVGQAFIDRYGSLDALKNTVQNDPVGFLTDISGAGMATKVGKVQKVASAVEPITLATRTAKNTVQAAKTAVNALIPENYANKLYESAVKFSTTLTPERRAKMVETALENKIMPTEKGAILLQSKITALNDQLDRLITMATDKGVKIPVNAIFTHLNELRRDKGGIKIESASDLAAINAIAKRFHQSLEGKKTITPEELQAFKIDAYDKINWDAKRMTGSPIKEDTYKAMARAAKDALAQKIKEAPEINALLGELYELQPHLIRAANRIDNRNILSINTPLNVSAGSIAGEIIGSGKAGMLAGLITSTLGNPKMKARIAIALNKLKDGDIKWLDDNIGKTEVVVALALAGRAEELINDQRDDQ